MPVVTILDGQPTCHLAWAILEQLAIGMDLIRARRERTAAQLGVIVLPDGEDRRAGCTNTGDSLDAVVGAGGQIDDDPIDVGQHALEAGRRPDGNGDPVACVDQVGQARRPDQVICEDRDPRRQSSVSAR